MGLTVTKGKKFIIEGRVGTVDRMCNGQAYITFEMVNHRRNTNEGWYTMKELSNYKEKK